MSLLVPYELYPYYNKDGYFISYFGDIYYGNIYTHLRFEDYAFIVSPNTRIEFRRLLDKEYNTVTFDQLANISREIKSFEIFLDVIDGKQDLGEKAPNYDNNSYGSHCKKMFVFGAGASAFSVFNDEIEAYRNFAFSSPIGNELFSKKFEAFIRRYLGVQLSLPSLRLSGNNVEAFFEKDWNQIKSSRNTDLLSKHINIAFFLRELFLKISEETVQEFRHHSLYAALADRLKSYANEKRRIGIVSFNYDTILEYYLGQVFRTPFTSMNDYVSNKNPFLLYKPHGSCNWGIPLSQNFLNACNDEVPDFIYQSQLSFADIYYRYMGPLKTMINQDSWGQEYEISGYKSGRFTVNKNKIEVIGKNNDRYFPSLLIPYQSKDEFVMPYYHYDSMKSFTSDMEDLYLIGWKGNEAAFNSLVKRNANSLKRIYIVNPAPDEVRNNLESFIDFSKMQIQHYNDFQTFLEQHNLED